MFKLMFWVALIATFVVVGGKTIPVYYNNIKIQNVFEGLVEGLPNANDTDIHSRLRQLFIMQSIKTKNLPEAFYENLKIYRDNGKLELSTNYHIVVWVLGRPTSVNPDEDYLEHDVKGLDKLRLKTRLDLNFSPAAITP